MTQLNVDRRYSIEQMRGQFLNQGTATEQNAPIGKGQSFAEILEQKKIAERGELKFSKHASERLVSRNIDLSESQKERLNHAVQAAEAKGIKESLVMMDNLAFIVNVKNNTVITAVAGGEEKIFSNIDGAVVV
ncbi:MAG: flagellar protein [Lachnospiraceae bacterium]|nr:flagellar protein [Lachnospiraceae bacterium]